VSLTLDRLGFGFLQFADDALRTLFMTAIVLGVGRLLFLAILALVHRRAELPDPPPPADETRPSPS
jgi:hypothetical protein